MLDLVAEGQALDIGSITRLQQLKTGALIEFAVEAACIMGRLPPEARTPYRGYARDIGLAFQIADDLLDHAGDEAAAGKRLRKDAGGRQGDVRLAAGRGPGARSNARCWSARRSSISTIMARKRTCSAPSPAMSQERDR